MAKTNESDVNLGTLFAQKAFRIPQYQRGYAWGEKQWEDLWDDIWEIEKDKNGTYRPHFTGSIALKRIERTLIPKEELWFAESGQEFYDVVDGQQRLTTIEILMCGLISAYQDQNVKMGLTSRYIVQKELGGDGKVYLFSYKYGDKNLAFLMNKIFDDTSYILPVDHNNIYTSNLLKAKDWFTNKISELNPIEQNDLLLRLQTALVFDVKYIDDNISEQAVFETMNNRGKPLTILEKLKNRLLFLASKLPQGSDIYEVSRVINDAWRNIYDYLGKNPEYMLNEDEFLSAHLSLIRVPSGYVFSEEIAEKKVFEMFCNRADKYPLNYTRNQGEDSEREPKVDVEKITNYAISISEFARYWYESMNSDDERIKKLLYLNGSKEMRILISTLLREMVIGDKEDANCCIDKLLKIVFRNTVPGLWIMDERTFATTARDVYGKGCTIAEVIVEYNKLLNQECNVDEVVSQFGTLFTYIRGNKGYHRWNGLKYFLMSYNDSLKGNDFSITWDCYPELNIEHVMPQSYWQHWQSVMDDYIMGLDIVDDDKFYAKNILINTLGNLSIIKDTKNPELKNDGWEEKQNRYKEGTLSEVEISRYVSWDKVSIRERGLKMLEYMEKMIDGLHFTDEQKDKMLFKEEKYMFKKEGA